MFVWMTVMAPLSGDSAFENCHGVACAELSVPAQLMLGESLVDNHPQAGQYRFRCPQHGVWFWDYAHQQYGVCPVCQADSEDLHQYEPLQEQWFPWINDDAVTDPHQKYRSVDLLASVCLGSSDGSWKHADDRHWQCQLEDLTLQGRMLHSSLQELYGIVPALLTFLDT